MRATLLLAAAWGMFTETTTATTTTCLDPTEKTKMGHTQEFKVAAIAGSLDCSRAVVSFRCAVPRDGFARCR